MKRINGITTAKEIEQLTRKYFDNKVHTYSYPIKKLCKVGV